MDKEKVIKALHDARRYLEDKEWGDLGFCESPDDMSEEQKAELRAIAKKFYPEDGEDE